MDATPGGASLIAERTSLDELLAAMPQARVHLCTDAYWAWMAGVDLSISRLSDRVAAPDPIWHYAKRGPGLRPRFVMGGTLATPDGSRPAQAEAILRALPDHRDLDAFRLRLIPDPGLRRDAGVRPTGDRRYTEVWASSPFPHVLPLGTDFDDFLAGLGKHTRHNLRRALKNAAASGMRFEFRAEAPGGDIAEREWLAARTKPVPRTPVRLARVDAFLRQRANPFQAILRARDGTLLSLVAGFCAGDAAFLMYQLNDGERPADSLSTTNRAFLIGALPQRGVHELIFPTGIRGILRHACREQPAFEFVFLRRSPRAWISNISVMLTSGDRSIRPIELAIRTTWRKKRRQLQRYAARRP